MTQRIALVEASGRIQQLQSGDFITTGEELGRRNVIINGNFDINQAVSVNALIGNGSGANDARVCDLWDVKCVSTAGEIQVTGPTASFLPTIAQSNTYSSKSVELDVFATTSTVAASDEAYLYARVEGYDWRALAQRTTTLSFWVNSVLAGTYCVALRNNGQDRSCVFEYTINSANTWEKKTIHFPASPSAGTWVYDNTGVGVDVVFTLMAGSNFQASPGSWVSGNVFSTTNQVNFLSGTNAFNLAQVQLEAGDSASSFEENTWQKTLEACERYWCKTFPYATLPNNNTAVTGALSYRAIVRRNVVHSAIFVYPIIMRVAPTIKYFQPSSSVGPISWWNVTGAAQSGIPVSDLINEHSVIVKNPQVTADAAGNEIAVHITADARFAFAG